jgi:hypothetical protein
MNILTNCLQYPKDEAPAANRDFHAVLDSVKSAALASEVARLKARFVIKDADPSSLSDLKRKMLISESTTFWR